MIARFTTIWHRWVWGDKALGLHVHIGEGDHYTIHQLVFENKKQQLQVVEASDVLSSLDQLPPVTDNPPVMLVVTGKGVVTKRIPRTIGGEDEQVGQQLAEFGNNQVAYAVSIQPDWIYVSVLRNEVMQGWLTRFKDAGFNVVALHVGAPIVWEALRFLDNEGTVHTGDHEATFTSNGLSVIRPNDEPSVRYLLGGDTVEGNQLLPYAAVIAFLQSMEPSHETNATVREQREDAYHVRAFRKLGLVGIAAIFLILLMNAGLFMHFHEKQTVLESDLSEYKTKLDELELMKLELKRRQEIVTVSGSGTHGRFAYFADRLAGTVPKEITLTALIINPVKQKRKSTDRIEVKPSVIEVSGSCERSEELNSWLEDVKAIDVVKALQITGFGKKDAERLNTFSVEILMKN